MSEKFSSEKDTNINQQKNDNPKKKFVRKDSVQFTKRCSILDIFESTSEINKSFFRGMYYLLVLFSGFYLVQTITINYLHKNEFFKKNLLQSFKKDFFFVSFCWPIFGIFSYSALILQKLAIQGLPQKYVYAIHYALVATLQLYSIQVGMKYDYSIPHKIYLICQACIFSMKMHAYMISNRDFRESAQNKNNDEKSNTNEIKYPANITFSNFTYFLFAPTLIYQIDYPRSDHKIRVYYLLFKLFQLVGTFLLAYVITAEMIMPLGELAEQRKITSLELMGKLVMPLSLITLTIFFMIFEVILNIFAEVTRFGDRQFYQDWWNATQILEFNRKWNRPVGRFLYTYIYSEFINRYQCSESTAKLVTLFVSSILHEILPFVFFEEVFPILFVFMMFQIPIFLIEKKLNSLFVNKTVQTMLGNGYLWFSILFGPALLANFYISHVYQLKLY